MRFSTVHLLLALGLSAAAAAAFLLGREDAPSHLARNAEPQYNPPANPGGLSGRVQIQPLTLGTYGCYEEKSSPAWELRHDPDLAARLGYSGEDVLLLRCDCGRVIRILDHRIDAGGTVNPSIWHDVPECGWHIWGRLEGWEHGEWSGVK